MRPSTGLLATLLVIGTWGWNAAATAKELPPDLILFNGKIFMSDPDHPYVQALAIRRERIIALGDSDKITALTIVNVGKRPGKTRCGTAYPVAFGYSAWGFRTVEACFQPDTV
jgi:hypothetical protein